MKPVPELKQNKKQSENCLKDYSMLIYNASLSVTCFYILQLMSNLQRYLFFCRGFKQEFCMHTTWSSHIIHKLIMLKYPVKSMNHEAPQNAFLSRAQSTFFRSKCHPQIFILTRNIYFLQISCGLFTGSHNFGELDAFIFRVEVTLVISYQTIRCHLSEQQSSSSPPR